MARTSRQIFDPSQELENYLKSPSYDFKIFRLSCNLCSLSPQKLTFQLSYNNTLLYEEYLTNVFKSFKHPSLDIALSKNCAEDLQLILEAVKNIFTGNNETTEFLFGAVVPSKLKMKKFLTNILVLDSYGKVPPGLFKGAFRIWGYEPECSQINFNLPDRDFQGSYSR